VTVAISFGVKYRARKGEMKIWRKLHAKGRAQINPMVGFDRCRPLGEQRGEEHVHRQ
jgi:hypothetical protein